MKSGNEKLEHFREARMIMKDLKLHQKGIVDKALVA